jgi:hypothetical protein
MARQKKSIVEKVQEEMPEFAGEVAGLGVDMLNARLAQLAKDSQANEQAKEDDEDLESARANASELGAPYRDAKKAINLRSKYIIKLIEDKGGK